MRNAKKLLALVLAFVMVFGMVPMASAQTIHTHGIEEYTEIELGETYVIEIAESGEIVYVRYTPEVTAEYTFASTGADSALMIDPEGYLYDSEMNLLINHSDNSAIDFNFTIVYTLEAGKTYVYAAKLFSPYRAGVEFYVTLTADLPDAHNYVGVVTKEATCTEDGVITYTCDHCGDSYTEVIAASHDYVEGVCTRCGEAYAIGGVCGDDVTWSLDYFGNMTISGTGAMYDYTRYGETVAPWAEAAADIRTLVVAEGVTTIGNFAFYGCGNLTAVTLPDGLTTVGESAFRSCEQLATVEFGTGLTTVSPLAFMNCFALTGADLGSQVDLIGNSAFFNCSSLAEVNLGDCLRGIDTLAFFGCTSLKTVSMPDTVVALGSDVFSGCTSLETAVLSNGLVNLPGYTFNECFSLKSVTMPEYLTTIGVRAFYRCESLEEIQMPFSMIAIDDDAFGHCTSLTEIQFPMALSYVGYFAFNGCTGLTNLDFPPNLTYFTGGCFYNCTGLTEIVFPEGTTYVDDDAFVGCTNVTKIVFQGSLPTILGAFEGITADAFYPAGDGTWTSDALLNYGGNLTWHALCVDHSYGKWTPVVPATCTESGIDERICSKCTWSEERVSQPAGHIWDDEGVENEDGEMVYSCLICGETTGELPFVNPFSDVNEVTHASFYDAIMWAVQTGITTGSDETHFNPNGKCDRATIVTFLWRAAGKPEPTTTVNPFVDVKESNFFYKAVLWAYENGITTGTDASHFNPYGKCSRAQVVTFLWRAEGQPAATGTESGFSDVTATNAYYYNAVLWAVENGITNGMGGGKFGVNAICNRAQVVTFLYRCNQN